MLSPHATHARTASPIAGTAHPRLSLYIPRVGSGLAKRNLCSVVFGPCHQTPSNVERSKLCGGRLPGDGWRRLPVRRSLSQATDRRYPSYRSPFVGVFSISSHVILLSYYCTAATRTRYLGFVKKKRSVFLPSLRSECPYFFSVPCLASASSRLMPATGARAVDRERGGVAGGLEECRPDHGVQLHVSRAVGMCEFGQ